jgi:hypothetical protein
MRLKVDVRDIPTSQGTGDDTNLNPLVVSVMEEIKVLSRI